MAAPLRRWWTRHAGVVVALALAAAACGDSHELELLAFADEVAATCSRVGTEMAAGWRASERIRGRPITYEQADLAHLEGSRDRCRGALALLDELDRQRSPLDGGAERDLRTLVDLDRLLLRTVADPSMESTTFLATQSEFVAGWERLRPRLRGSLPLSTTLQQQLAGALLPRWDAATAEAQDAR